MEKGEFVEVLKNFRETSGYSVSNMAVMLGMSQQAYEFLETGAAMPELEDTERIMNLIYFHLNTMRNLYDGKKPMEIVSYLKRRLLEGSTSTRHVLIIFAHLAQKSEWEPVIEWLELELVGRSTDPFEVPLYRLQESGYDIEYEQGGLTHYMSLPREFIESIQKRGCFVFDDPIDQEDEKWARTPVLIPVDDEREESLELSLQSVYGSDFKLIRVAGMISAQFLQKILLAVQEIMLTFLIYLETELDQDASLDDLKAYKHMAGLKFREIINTLGSAEHLDLPMKPPSQEEELVLIKDDEDRFCDWLDQHEVTLFEMDGFLTLRETLEESPPREGIVPPEMFDWARKVTSSNWRFRQEEGKLMNGLKVFYGVKS